MKNALLWKITHPKIATTSYLFGTMHARDQRAFEQLAPVLQAIRECDAMATEFNLEEAQHNAQANSLDLPDNQSLSDLLGKKKYKKLQQQLLKMSGIDIHPLQRMLPIILTNVLTESVLAKEQAVSLDEFLWRFAREEEKIQLGVETYQEQLDILKKIPLDYQLKSLKDIAKNFKRFRKQILRTVALYKQADIDKLYKITKKSSGKLRKLMLYQRNEIMAERIGKMVAEQSTMAAIGAAHLAGKKGVLRFLKKQGFKLEAVKMEA